MRARLFGFKLTLGAINLDDFFANLATLREIEFKHIYEHRLIYVSQRDDFHLGLLLNAKTLRRYCELLEVKEGDEKKSMAVNIRKLEEGKRVVDFNFFVVHKQTGRGLYLHYHGSCGTSGFFSFLKRRYDDLRKKRKTAEIDAISEKTDKATNEKAKAIREKYKQSLEGQVFHTNEDFKTILNKLSQIRSCTIDLDKLQVPTTYISCAKDEIATYRQCFTFAKIPVGKVRTLVTNLIKNTGSDLQDLSIVAIDPDTGAPETIHLHENVKSFERYDFDEITKDSFIDLDEIGNCPLFSDILSVISENEAYFSWPGKKK